MCEVTITAREVYKMQSALRHAEHRLEEMAAENMAAARRGAPVSTLDYLNSPEAREVEKMRGRVVAAQDEVGGIVYRIPSVNFEALTGKLDKLAKRAQKLGVAEVSYRVDPEVERVERKRDPLLDMAELGYVPSFPGSYRYVAVRAGVVKLEGWMFLATLTVEPGGVMISKVPGFARAWALHRQGVTERAPHNDGDEVSKAAGASLDAMDLSAYRDEAKATMCDHCGKARRRTKTYLVEHVETGEIKTVGSNCLRDFMGADPGNIAKYAEVLWEIEGAVGDGEAGRGGRETLTEEYLAHVCCMLRVEGWSPRAAGSGATADAAWRNLRSYGKVEKGHEIFEHLIEDDHARALAALKWAREYLGEKKHNGEGLSDFDHNLYVAARGDTVPKKGDGILAYLPVAHARALEREVERKLRDEQRRETEGNSEHVGSVGDRIEVAGTVASVYERPGDWGTTFITKIVGDDGNVYKWFGSYGLDIGSKVVAKFTVKKHDEFKGVKETVLTRPSGLREPVEGVYAE